MNLKDVSIAIENDLSGLFSELKSGISAREDSRAFGAMIQQRITNNWDKICKNLGYTPLTIPGRKSIWDSAFRGENGETVGIDVKTKDLDDDAYSDGGICAVGNLLKFLANDKGVFLLAEFGHRSSEKPGHRDIEYIRVAPFTMLPRHAYRIENLGTGQVRLNCTIDEVWSEIEWERDQKAFFNIFVDLATKHYERVSRDAARRIKSLESFQANGFTSVSFGRG